MPPPITFSASDVEPTTAVGAPVRFSADDLKPNFTQSDRTPNELDPNTLGTLARHLWSGINPVQIGQMLPFPKSLGGSGMDNPLLPSNVVKSLSHIKQQADAAMSKGDYVGAVAKYVESVIPVLGPMMSQQGDEWQQGKYAAGLGDAGALAVNAAAPHLLGAAGRAIPSSVADAADAAANRRIVDVIAPKIGPNKTRFGNMGAQVAPDVARETTGLTRSSVAESIASKLDDATAALDDATSARLGTRPVPTRPILDALQAVKDKFTAQAVQGSQFQPQTGVNRPPIGQDVVPAPNAARVAQIDQAMKEIQQLGSTTRYEPLRTIRQAYDGPAKAVYSPAVTADYLTAQGSKLGAADVTGVLRDQLAKLDPNTAAANADYSLWKKASDVISAAEETERVRPTVGRILMARGLGAAAGAAEGGGLGAAVGAVIGPMVERGLTSLAPAMKLTVARQLASLADAIRSGNVSRAQTIVSTVQRMVPAAQGAPLRSNVPMALPAAAQDQTGAQP